MNLSDAYKTLGLSKDASPEEAKKRYRELTKKYHPDVNKEPDAEEKFKKINEAYEIIKSGKDDTVIDQHGQWAYQDFINISDIFNINNIRRKQSKGVRYETDISLHTTISFKESVLGCKKNFTYKRKLKCDLCGGDGSAPIHNGCTQCNGTGFITSRHGNMISQSTCNKCMGRQQTEDCKKCNTTGFLEVDTSISISIPAGILDGQILRLQHMGNYAGYINNMFNETDIYTNANLLVNVEKIPGLRLENQDVVSMINISLLEALEGCTKSIETIDGNVDISIPQKTKNKDEVILPNLGVNRKGNHRVIINIEYPSNIDNLISYLKGETV
jgi:molecular chaperone DnaJ